METMSDSTIPNVVEQYYKLFKYIKETGKLYYLNCCGDRTPDDKRMDYRITYQQGQYDGFETIHVFCKKCGYILSSFDKITLERCMRRE